MSSLTLHLRSTSDRLEARTFEPLARDESARVEAVLRRADLLPARLHVEVSESAERTVSARLRLACSDRLLQTEATGRTVRSALRRAFAQLARQTERVATRLAGEPDWKRAWRRQRFAPTAGYDGLPDLWDAEATHLTTYARHLVEPQEVPSPDTADRTHEALARARRDVATRTEALPEHVSARAALYRAVRTAAADLGAPLASEDGDDPAPLLSSTPPRGWRGEVYLLYFREGFEEDEIAWILDRPQEEVRAAIDALNQEIRAHLVQAREPDGLRLP